VPTMGALHEGHLSLIRRVNEQSDIVVVSIFVNPTQFGPDEDLAEYPRDLIRDTDLCIREGVDYLFTPEVDEVYPAGPQTYVEIPDLANRLEGVSRPGHFRGVTTVVMKLFSIVGPHVAAFGQKDAQQLALVRRMIEDLWLRIDLITGATVRDDRGLALSSRNRYLSEGEYEAALAIPHALEAARVADDGGRGTPDGVKAAARSVLEAEPKIEIDYVEFVQPRTFESVEKAGEGGLVLIAVRCGKTRLIDNALLEPKAEEGRAQRSPGN